MIAGAQQRNAFLLLQGLSRFFTHCGFSGLSAFKGLTWPVGEALDFPSHVLDEELPEVYIAKMSIHELPRVWMSLVSHKYHRYV